MSPFGNGGWYRSTNQKKYFTIEWKYLSKFIVDETQIKVGKDYFWLCVAIIKPKDKDILSSYS